MPILEKIIRFAAIAIAVLFIGLSLVRHLRRVVR